MVTKTHIPKIVSRERGSSAGDLLLIYNAFLNVRTRAQYSIYHGGATLNN